MTRIPGLLVALCLAMLAPWPGVAAEDADNALEARIDQVETARATAYESQLAAFDDAIKLRPADATDLILKCRFIQRFDWEEEFPIERTSGDYEQCTASLKDRFPADADAQLFVLDSLWGQEAVEAGDALLDRSRTWSPQQQARLHERLAAGYQGMEPQRATSHHRIALDLDPNSSGRMEVVESTIDRGAVDRARELIMGAPNDFWNPQKVRQAVNLLLRIDAAEEAVTLIGASDQDTSDPGTRLLLARALYLARDHGKAAQLYAEALKDGSAGWTQANRIAHFEFTLAHGTAGEAVAAYRRLRDPGYSSDPYGRFRLALLLKHPVAAWQWRDTLGPLMLLALLAFIAAIPLLVIGPVHYRSLARRLRGVPVEEGHWSLRSVWILTALMLAADVLLVFVYAYGTFLDAFYWSYAPTADLQPLTPRLAAHFLIAQLSVFALFLAPFLWKVDLRQLFLGNGRVVRDIGLAVGAFLFLRLLGTFLMRGWAALSDTAALGDLTTQLIQGVQISHGPIVGIALLALVVPVLEEIAFRGIILLGLARYVKFGWAALIQAALFAVFHESAEAMPYIFILALTSAWLVRKTGGLLASIILHGLNNGVAYGSLVVLGKLAL